MRGRPFCFNGAFSAGITLIKVSMERSSEQQPHVARQVNSRQITLADRAEYAVVRVVLGGLRYLPRVVSRALGSLVGMVTFYTARRLRSVGLQNLHLAFPQVAPKERDKLLKAEYRQLGHHLAEFARMPRYSRKTLERIIEYQGLEHFERASAKGCGVLVLTGHLGAWELSSFFHSIMGHSMGMVIRRLDNPLLDRYVNEVRCMHGNRVLSKDDFARGLLLEMKAGRTVGILMDTNMTPPQGTFVPFFGVPACTGSGLARIARKTGAAVLPGFLLEEPGGRYRLHFGEEIALDVTSDSERDAISNTGRFTAVIEKYVREYPEQWLWMHRRWKTRPAGEPRIYA